MQDREDVKKDGAETESKTSGLPPAGPHADPRLTNPDATPGAGTMPAVGETDEPNMQPSS